MIILDQDDNLIHAAFLLSDEGKVRLYNNYEDFTILYMGLINNDSDKNKFEKKTKEKKEGFELVEISSDLKYFYFKIRTTYEEL